jgi:hypothetical protein
MNSLPLRSDSELQVWLELARLTLQAELLGIDVKKHKAHRASLGELCTLEYSKIDVHGVVGDSAVIAQLASAMYAGAMASIVHAIASLLDAQHQDLVPILRRSLYEYSVRGRYYARHQEAAAIDFQESAH